MESEREYRDDPIEIHMAKKAVQQIMRRYREQAHRVQQALAVACRVAEGETADLIEGDHPLFHVIFKDLGQEIP